MPGMRYYDRAFKSIYSGRRLPLKPAYSFSRAQLTAHSFRRLWPLRRECAIRHDCAGWWLADAVATTTREQRCESINVWDRWRVALEGRAARNHPNDRTQRKRSRRAVLQDAINSQNQYRGGPPRK